MVGLVRASRCDLRRIWIPIGMTLAQITAGAAVAGAIAIVPGCGSTCGTDCPAVVFDVFATTGENLAIATAHWTGSACPLDQPNTCSPDTANNLPCARLSILGIQPGTCQLDLTFNDGRAPFSVTTEFGPETHQGCCHGFPVVGPALVYIPPLHPTATDAGTDAETDAPTSSPDAAAEGGTTDSGDTPPPRTDTEIAGDAGDDGG
jgi:hypothetical protein